MLGRYIARLTFFSQITGIGVEEITYAPKNTTVHQLAIEAAMCTGDRASSPSELTKTPDKRQLL